MLSKIRVLRVEKLHAVGVAEMAEVVVLAQVLVQFVLVNPSKSWISSLYLILPLDIFLFAFNSTEIPH